MSRTNKTQNTAYLGAFHNLLLILPREDCNPSAGGL